MTLMPKSRAANDLPGSTQHPEPQEQAPLDADGEPEGLRWAENSNSTFGAYRWGKGESNLGACCVGDQAFAQSYTKYGSRSRSASVRAHAAGRNRRPTQRHLKNGCCANSHFKSYCRAL
jgi:hypothetical protein